MVLGQLPGFLSECSDRGDVTMCAKTLCHCPIDFGFTAMLSAAEEWGMTLPEGAADLRALFWVWQPSLE